MSHPFVRQYNLPSGTIGTKDTLGRMARLVRMSTYLPPVRSFAVKLVGMTHGQDWESHAYAIRAFLASAFMFVRDPSGIEQLHSPLYLLQQFTQEGSIHGDCDDAAIIGAALALSVGLQARFVAVGFTAEGGFQHVWAEASAPYAGQSWVELDVTRQGQYLEGVVGQRLVWPV